MQDRGDVRADIDTTATAKALLATIQGGVQVLIATGQADHLEAGLDLVRAGLGLGGT